MSSSTPPMANYKYGFGVEAKGTNSLLESPSLIPLEGRCNQRYKHYNNYSQKIFRVDLPISQPPQNAYPSGKRVTHPRGVKYGALTHYNLIIHFFTGIRKCNFAFSKYCHRSLSKPYRKDFFGTIKRSGNRVR